MEERSLDERVAQLKLPAALETLLVRVVHSLRARLHENLHACVVYGSAVRGAFVPGVSDVNLLLTLEASTPEAHGAIAEVLRAEPQIAPFVVERGELPRTARVFAPKFRSIQRAYRVLDGIDPLGGLTFDDRVIRFLAEQQLRNLRLRLARAFILWGHDRQRYGRYLVHSTAAVVAAISDALRCAGIAMPPSLTARLPAIGRALDADVTVLAQLLNLRRTPRPLALAELGRLHGELFRLVDRGVRWMEAGWPEPSPPQT